MSAGAIAPAGGGRTIFVLPWLGQTLIGTTDNDYEGDLEHVQPALDDVDYLLEAVNAFFATDLGPGDVAGAYAGVRPLISTGDPKKSVDISRKAELYETSSGMVTITGGKLTTWRRMAKMTVDRIVEREGRDAPCRTHEVPLGMAVEPADLPHVPGVAPEAYEQLAGRYGYAAHEVLRIAARRPELAEPVVPGRADLLAEAVYAGAPRAGAHRRRRAAAAHAARADRGARAAVRRRRGRGARVARARWRPSCGWDEARRDARGGGVRRGGGRRGDRGLLARPPSWAVVTFTAPPVGPPYAPPRGPPRRPHRPARPSRSCSRRPRRPAGSGADVVDGPAEIDALGDVDLARDGTGGLVYLKRDAGVPQVFLSRLDAGAWHPPERSPAAAPVDRGGGDRHRRRPAGRRLGRGRRGVGDRRSRRPRRPRRPRRRCCWAAAARAASRSTWASTRTATPSGRRGGDVHAARLDGTAWTPLAGAAGHRPGAPGRTALRPRVAVSAEGNAVATWAETDADGRTTSARR